MLLWVITKNSRGTSMSNKKILIEKIDDLRIRIATCSEYLEDASICRKEKARAYKMQSMFKSELEELLAWREQC